MKPSTFLDLSLKPWSYSLSVHFLFFLALILMGRQRALDITFIDLDLAPSLQNSTALSLTPLEEEWQKPRSPKRLPPPTPDKPPVQPPPVAASVPGPGPAAGGVGKGEFRSIAQVSQLPHFIHQVKTQYPDQAKRANIEGVVILQVDIDAEGAVKKVDLIQGLGYGCDEAALTAVQQSTFTPALAGGEPVPVRIRIPYRFKFEY